MPADPIDRKAMLREAYDAATEEDDAPETTDDAPEVEAAPEEPATPVEASADDAPADDPAPREGRDDKGRFVPAAKDAPKPKDKTAPAAAAPAAAPVVKPAAPAPATPTAPATRPPQSWTAAEREAWAKMPTDAQRAVLRTEAETRRVLQENAQVRKVAGEASQYRQQVEGFVKRFDPIFASEGLDSMQGMANVLQTYGQLHYGNQQQKDGILFGLIQRFGSIDGLNAMLEGKAPPPAAQRQPGPAPRQQPVDVEAAVQRALESRMEQARATKADRDWSEFQDSSPEFLDTPGVQESMQVFLDAAAARGRNPSYSDAYDYALKMDQEIQSILQQRAAAAAVTQPSATAPTARARTAAATVRSKPAGVASEEPDLTDRRATIERMARRARP